MTRTLTTVVAAAVTAQPNPVTLLGECQVNVVATDDDVLTYRWSANVGMFQEPSAAASRWTAPDSAGTFTLTALVSDGTDSTESSVDVAVGNVSVTVESDPPDALITLDGSVTGKRTPHTFDPLPPGPHRATLFNPDFAYSAGTVSTDLVHGESDTLRFSTEPGQSSPFDPGRDDFLEVAAVAFLPNGLGIVYSARTVAGTGIFTSGLNPPSGTPNGLKLVGNVRLEEPISVSDNGSYIFFVTEGESLMAVEIGNFANGIVDTVLAIHPLRRDAYGPSISPQDNVAFTLTRSEEPATFKILNAKFENNALEASPPFVTNLNGRVPTWNPDGAFLAYEFNGDLYTTFVSPGFVFPADSLAFGDFNTAPAWGSFGSGHVAYLHGLDDMSLSEIRFAVSGNPNTVLVYSPLSDPRYIAWSPTQRQLVVTHNSAGQGEILLISNLPIP
jgi:hypothetical protein